MGPACVKSDYELLITEEYFPFWDETTREVWREGLGRFQELFGDAPDAAVEDHAILCQLLLERGRAMRYDLAGADAERFLGLDEELKARSLCWDSESFIATPQVTRELLIVLAGKRNKGCVR